MLKMISEFSLQGLFVPSLVGGLLREVFRRSGLPDEQPSKIAVERCWPTGKDAFVFEWSFDCVSGDRHTIFGKYPVEERDIRRDAQEGTGRFSPSGLRNIDVYLHEYRLHVHTPDCDPSMSHLASCLDAKQMARRLGPIIDSFSGKTECNDNDFDCQILSYRAGRRATLAYHFNQGKSRCRSLVGKTYRNGRAERLLDIHAQLNEQLRWYSNGRVRVARPVDYVSNLRVALFAWMGSNPERSTAGTPDPSINLHIDALASLHCVTLEDLPEFSITDECNIITKWFNILLQTDLAKAKIAEPIWGDLLRKSETVDTTRKCTIHRDFYDRQLVTARRTTTILDLDTLAIGNPCIDLGNYLAHWMLDLCERNSRSGEIVSLTSSAIERFESNGGPVDRETLAWYWASALFRIGAVHALRTATRRHSTVLWDGAHRLLSENHQDWPTRVQSVLAGCSAESKDIHA